MGFYLGSQRPGHEEAAVADLPVRGCGRLLGSQVSWRIWSSPFPWGFMTAAEPGLLKTLHLRTVR